MLLNLDHLFDYVLIFSCDCRIRFILVRFFIPFSNENEQWENGIIAALDRYFEIQA